MTSKIKVVSWNILASEWIIKKDYPDIKTAELFNTKKRIKTIIDKLKKYNADIILLQEVMPDDYKIIQKYFIDDYHVTEIQPIKWSYKNNNNHKSKSGNITLLRKSKYTLLQLNLDTVSDTIPDTISDTVSNIMQFCKITQCCNIESNKIMTLYNIHLDDLSSVKRNKQMKQLLDFDRELNKKNKAKTTSMSSTSPCIIAGDFNQIYRDTSKLYTIPKFKVHNFCNTYYIEKNINIDNILTRGFKEDKELTKCTNLKNDTEDIFKTIGSDHIPVITNIVL
jgi:endonuclease/exonuclease/phosphatase family metal-dependent hydrolase